MTGFIASAGAVLFPAIVILYVWGLPQGVSGRIGNILKGSFKKRIWFAVVQANANFFSVPQFDNEAMSA